jgi:cysteine desulfurase
MIVAVVGFGTLAHLKTPIGVSKENLAGALRFSLGRSTTAADVEKVIEVLPGIVERLRVG